MPQHPQACKGTNLSDLYNWLMELQDWWSCCSIEKDEKI